MTLVLVFAATLLAAVLISELASRSVVSTSVLFLAVGFAAGPEVLGWVDVSVGDPAVARLVELALFTVLFTDGMRVGARELAGAWRLPGRALLLGMPLALLGTAALAAGLLGFGPAQALLIGAVLAPTDPVFASSIVGREEVPHRLRRLLNVESGVNDGLALPFVVVLVASAGGAAGPGPAALAAEVALGVAIGVAVPLVALWLERRPGLATHRLYEPLLAFSIALLVYALTSLSHANAYLAAFSAGITVASAHERARDEFHAFGETLVELLKLAALLVFGALVAPSFFTALGAADALFVVLVLLAVRPLAVGAALLRSRLGPRERFAAAWFGPKGFASVAYALYVLGHGTPAADRIYHLVAIVIAVSIVAHSSTDVPIARWFRREAEGAGEDAGRGGEPEEVHPGGG